MNMMAVTMLTVGDGDCDGDADCYGHARDGILTLVGVILLAMAIVRLTAAYKMRWVQLWWVIMVMAMARRDADWGGHLAIF